LLGNPLAAPSAIAPFHFKDRVDQFFRGAFGTWPTASSSGSLLREGISGVGSIRFSNCFRCLAASTIVLPYNVQT
jgi:hypothetical protein